MILETLVDIPRSDLTLPQVLALVADYQSRHPRRKVWLDGDLNAIVAEVQP